MSGRTEAREPRTRCLGKDLGKGSSGFEDVPTLRRRWLPVEEFGDASSRTAKGQAGWEPSSSRIAVSTVARFERLSCRMNT